MFSRLISNIKSFVARFPIGVGLVAGLLVGALAVSAAVGNSIKEEESSSHSFVREVTLARVSALSTEGTELSLIGTVKASSEAVVQTEAQGQIVSVRYGLGDFVAEGAVIASLENRSERAAVTQAEGALEAARAALLRLERGTARSQVEALVDASETYRGAYTLASDAIYGKTDEFFSGARSSDPQIKIPVFGDTKLDDLRGDINDLLIRWQSNLSGITTENDLDMRLFFAQSDLAIIQNFLDRLSLVVNRRTPDATLSQTTNDAQKTAVLSARTNVNTALSNITSTRNALASSLPESSGVGTGKREADLAAARANVKQAEGSLASALAALEKTLIRAPFVGTINRIDLDRGNFVTAFAPVVTIANNNRLEITTFVSESERPFVSIGKEAVVNGIYTAVITRIAPAVDPATQKVEVKLSLSNGDDLKSGETARIAIFADESERAEDSPLSIPLTALKITPDGSVVFTVSPENTLIEHPVAEGPLSGDRVFITDGLTLDMEIVTDARGFLPGDTVRVK